MRLARICRGLVQTSTGLAIFISLLQMLFIELSMTKGVIGWLAAHPWLSLAQAIFNFSAATLLLRDSGRAR